MLIANRCFSKNKRIIFFPYIWNELSFCHKLLFSNHYIFGTRCCRPLIFQTMNYVRSNNHSLKYQRFTFSDRSDIGIRLFEFVTKTLYFRNYLGKAWPSLSANPLNDIRDVGNAFSRQRAIWYLFHIFTKQTKYLSKSF